MVVPRAVAHKGRVYVPNIKGGITVLDLIELRKAIQSNAIAEYRPKKISPCIFCDSVEVFSSGLVVSLNKDGVVEIPEAKKKRRLDSHLGHTYSTITRLQDKVIVSSYKVTRPNCRSIGPPSSSSIQRLRLLTTSLIKKTLIRETATLLLP